MFHNFDRHAYEQLTAAVEEAREAYATRNENAQRADEKAKYRIDEAEKVRNGQERWIDDRLAELTEAIDRGLAELPDEIDRAVTPMASALLPNAREGLQAAVNRAHDRADDLQKDARQLEEWEARLRQIRRILLFAILLIFVAFGLWWIWQTVQDRVGRIVIPQSPVVATIVVGQANTITSPPFETDRPTDMVVTQPFGEVYTDVPLEPTTAVPSPTYTPRPTLASRPSPTLGPIPTSLPPGAIVCPGAFPTHLVVGGRARVINYQLNVRSGPSTRYDIVRRLDPGRTVDVLDGPVCDDGQLWYYIVSEEIVPRDGSPSYRAEGWLVEESGDTYYLEPLR